MRAIRLLAVATVLAATSFGYVGTTLAQGAPPAGQNPHHPPAQGQAAPGPGGAMPMPGGAGGMGMMGMMGSGGSSPMMGGMMDHMSMMQMMGERTEGRLAFIKAELAVTEAQLPAWNAYADAVRTEAKRRTSAMPMGHAVPAATWIDRLTRQEQDLEQRLESLRRLKGVSSALYAALSATQKKTADEVLGGPMGRM